MTYKELLQWGIEELQKAEIQDAEVDAWLLMEHCMGIDRTHYLMQMMEETTKEACCRYQSYVEKRCKHIPLQYLTGTQDFMGLTFLVTQDVLIPRQDTECLVEEALSVVEKGNRVLDLCTGSGCILISILHERRDCEGMGADIAEASIAIAKENAKRNHVCAKWHTGNLFDGIEEKFHVIVSNPPYIASDELERLMPEVIRYEPRRALDGYEDGLYFYDKITEQAPDHLYPGGWLLYEIGWDQGSAVADRMRRAGFLDVQVIKDYCGKDRVVKGHLPDL